MSTPCLILQGTGDVVLDAGGNMGYVSISMALKQPDATVVAFEPDPLNYGLLQMNMALNHVENICAFNLALGNEDGLIHFYRSPNNFGDHRSAKPKGISLRESEFKKGTTSVPKVRASSLLAQCSMGQQLDLVKIDTQGADFEILGDILPLLKSTAKVAIEYSPYHLDANGTTRNQVVDLLQAFRTLYIIQPAPNSYKLELTDVHALGRFFDEQHEFYRTYCDLVLLK